MGKKKHKVKGQHLPKSSDQGSVSPSLLSTLEPSEFNTISEGVFSILDIPVLQDSSPSMANRPQHLQETNTDQAVLITQLKAQALSFQAQLYAHFSEYQKLEFQHQLLQKKSAEKGQQIDELLQRIAILDTQLKKIQISGLTASSDNPDHQNQPLSQTDLVQMLTTQVENLQQQLSDQRQARLNSEERAQALSDQLRIQGESLAALQQEINHLRNTANIGEIHLNRWQKHYFPS